MLSSAAQTFTAICVTVIASTASSIGKALQKEATKHLPKFSLDEKIIQQYRQDRTWLIGLVSDVSGGILQTGAFALAPVSILQPVSGVGLVGLAIYSHFYMQEVLYQWEWIAVGLAGLGTVGLGVSSASAGSTVDVHPGFFRMIFTLGAVGYGISKLTHVRNKQAKLLRGQGSLKVTSALYGLQAGGCFGLSASVIRTGFLMATYKRWTWAPLGIICGIGLSSTGFVLQTCGLKEGSTVVVCTCAAVTAMVVGVIVGLVGLGEAMPNSPSAVMMRLASWALLLYGVVVLSGGTRLVKEAVAWMIQKVPAKFWQQVPADIAVKIKNWAAHEQGLPEIHTSNHRGQD